MSSIVVGIYSVGIVDVVPTLLVVLAWYLLCE